MEHMKNAKRSILGILIVVLLLVAAGCGASKKVDSEQKPNAAMI